MDSIIKLLYKIIMIDVIILLVLIFLSFLLISEPMPWIKGYIFGGLIGILNFILLSNTMYRAANMQPEKASIYASANYFIRLLVTAIVVIIGLKAEYLNVFSVIIGLLLIKQIIFFLQLFGDKKFFKKL